MNGTRLNHWAWVGWVTRISPQRARLTRATRVDIQVLKRKKTTTTKRARQVERQNKLRQLHEPRPVRAAVFAVRRRRAGNVARVARRGAGEIQLRDKPNKSRRHRVGDIVGGGNSESNEEIIEFTWNWQVWAEAYVKNTGSRTHLRTRAVQGAHSALCAVVGAFS